MVLALESKESKRVCYHDEIYTIPGTAASPSLATICPTAFLTNP